MARITETAARCRRAVVTKKDEFRDAMHSTERFKRFLRVPGAQNDPEGRFTWLNEDLVPVPPENRNWTYRTYCFLYFSWSMDNWTLGSTMVGIGLNWWQSILVIFAGQSINSIFMALMSRPGAVYHVSFPLVARSVFGMTGSYFAVLSRSVLAIVYFSLKIYMGSHFIGNMLRAIFGHSYTNIPNHIPTSTGISTQGMLAFIISWLFYVPVMFLRPNQMRWVFTMKMISIIPAYIGLFIFCMATTNGQLGSGLQAAAKSSSSQFSWFIMEAINVVMGNSSPNITNQADLARWTSRRWAPVIPQVILNPLAITISFTLGILSTAAINDAWGLNMWNQWDLLDQMMTRFWRPEVRFAVFLCALGQTALVMGTNIIANIIPLGSDGSMVFPRYINFVRGQLLGLLLSWACIPWKILASATVFSTFLGGYGLFMAALVGPAVVEYYILSRGNMFIPDLYSGSDSKYWYWRGWNIQALAAYLVGTALPLPGFVGTLGATVPLVWTHMVHMGWLLSFFVSAAFYYLVCLIWPTPLHVIVREKAMAWEEVARQSERTLDGLRDDVELAEQKLEEEGTDKPVLGP
ncbi:permease for cytosine/purines, uracil, thiamine, allantoin-domain-containing protein [Aspergillus californicus]